jgi:hypothetical protein
MNVLACARANQCQKIRRYGTRLSCRRMARCLRKDLAARRMCLARAKCMRTRGSKRRSCLAGLPCQLASTPAQQQACRRAIACPDPAAEGPRPDHCTKRAILDACESIFPTSQSDYCAARQRVPGVPAFGKVRLGVYSLDDARFQETVGKAHLLRSSYLKWGDGVNWDGGRSLKSRLLSHANDGTTPVWHISNTTSAGGVLSLRDIATGVGDPYLLEMSSQLNVSRQVVMVRIMAEMNTWWNPYSAYKQSGAPRSDEYAPAAYRNAWARIALVLHGGNVGGINRALDARGLPPLRTDLSVLPASGLVATVWNPQGQGSPNVAGNQPADFYPGDEHVDWVANNLFSIRFRAFWSGMEPLYQFRPNKPFMIGEWAPWGIDDPAYVQQMFDWVDSHPRTEALVYYEGSSTWETFDLARKPGSLGIYRTRIAADRYQ